MVRSAIGLASVALLIGAHAAHATCPSFTAPSIRERLLPGDAVPPSAPPHSEAEIHVHGYYTLPPGPFTGRFTPS